jgi:hypothetical protein
MRIDDSGARFNLTATPTAAAAAPAARPKGSWLELDPDAFRSHFDRHAYLFRHQLHGHPLFALPRLIELAKRLPERYVEYNAGNVPVSQDWYKTPHTGLSPEETIRRIEECCSWMVLKRIDQDPEYRVLLNECLDQIEPLSAPLAPGMHTRAAAVFISSPNSVTPYHIDQEYNFLLQIRGLKQMTVFDASDRTVLSEEDLEDYFSKRTIDRNIPFKDEWQSRGTVFDMTPGTGVHVPSTAPHWVRNGPAVSISFSCGFVTRVTDRRACIYRLNHCLRQMDLRPAPFGRSRRRDAVKFVAFRAVRACGRLRRATLG